MLIAKTIAPRPRALSTFNAVSAADLVIALLFAVIFGGVVGVLLARLMDR